MWKNYLELIKIILIRIFLPAALLFILAVGTVASAIEWLFLTAGIGALISYTYITGEWFFFGLYFRFIFLTAFFGTAIISMRNMIGLPFFISLNLRVWIGIILFLVYSALTVFSIRGFRYKEDAIKLLFPFQEGHYCIAHGGRSALINHHWPASTSGYAIDIIKMNKFGFRALGFCPKNLSKYYIFGDIVHSPIDGMVVRAIDGLPDMLPPKEDIENPYGNHIIIKHSTENAYIFLLHLKQNSINVKVGEIVKTGKLIGRVGNSGCSTEPHLHIHCEIDVDDDSIIGGKRVPLVFSGKFLLRNDLVKI